MSITPGYVMIDATGAITSTGSTVTGLYKRCQEAIALGKPALLYGVVKTAAGAVYSPIAGVLQQGSNVVTIDTALGAYKVTSADAFSAVETQASNKSKK